MEGHGREKRVHIPSGACSGWQVLFVSDTTRYRIAAQQQISVRIRPTMGIGIMELREIKNIDKGKMIELYLIHTNSM
jgi:hypothetical protein